MVRYLLFSDPVIPDKIQVHCPSCGCGSTKDSDAVVGTCSQCHVTMIVDAPIIQSGLYCWTQAFREQGGVGEMFPSIDKDYLEKYDIVHINYTAGHPSYIEAVRDALGSSSTKIVANVDYAMSMWETINPFNMKHQLNMADMVFHVESTGAAALSRFLGRKIPVIPHPVDVRHLKQIECHPKTKPLATCQWHRYNATWSAYYYGLLGLNIKKYLVSFTQPNPSKLVNLETMFDRVVPSMYYVPYIESILSTATINLDLAPDNTFGRGLVDAAALGIPTIGSNTIEASRIIWPELSVKPHDHAATFEVAKKLLADRQFYADMAERGLEMCELYSCKSAYDKMMGALDGNY
jgi:hypothetical protein